MRAAKHRSMIMGLGMRYAALQLKAAVPCSPSQLVAPSCVTILRHHPASSSYTILLHHPAPSCCTILHQSVLSCGRHRIESHASRIAASLQYEDAESLVKHEFTKDGRPMAAWEPLSVALLVRSFVHVVAALWSCAVLCCTRSYASMLLAVSRCLQPVAQPAPLCRPSKAQPAPLLCFVGPARPCKVILPNPSLGPASPCSVALWPCSGPPCLRRALTRERGSPAPRKLST